MYVEIFRKKVTPRGRVRALIRLRCWARI